MQTMKWLKANYSYKAMEDGLKYAYGNLTLGSKELRTGLCIVAKRADTNSIWPLINHPKGKFFDSKLGKNKDIPLWMAVRASSAAPTYFAPQMIEVMKDQQAAFIDGGLSMANNPSLTLLMIATLKGFPFRWEMSEDNCCLFRLEPVTASLKNMPKKLTIPQYLIGPAIFPKCLCRMQAGKTGL